MLRSAIMARGRGTKLDGAEQRTHEKNIPVLQLGKSCCQKLQCCQELPCKAAICALMAFKTKICQA